VSHDEPPFLFPIVTTTGAQPPPWASAHAPSLARASS
jgi:hypothetical protein